MVEEQFSNAVITSQNNKSKSDVNTLNGGFKTGDVFEEMLKLDPEFKSRVADKTTKARETANHDSFAPLVLIGMIGALKQLVPAGQHTNTDSTTVCYRRNDEDNIIWAPIPPNCKTKPQMDALESNVRFTDLFIKATAISSDSGYAGTLALSITNKKMAPDAFNVYTLRHCGSTPNQTVILFVGGSRIWNNNSLAELTRRQTIPFCKDLRHCCSGDPDSLCSSTTDGEGDVIKYLMEEGMQVLKNANIESAKYNPSRSNSEQPQDLSALHKNAKGEIKRSSNKKHPINKNDLRDKDLTRILRDEEKFGENDATFIGVGIVITINAFMRIQQQDTLGEGWRLSGFNHEDPIGQILNQSQAVYSVDQVQNIRNMEEELVNEVLQKGFVSYAFLSEKAASGLIPQQAVDSPDRDVSSSFSKRQAMLLSHDEVTQTIIFRKEKKLTEREEREEREKQQLLLSEESYKKVLNAYHNIMTYELIPNYIDENDEEEDEMNNVTIFNYNMFWKSYNIHKDDWVKAYKFMKITLELPASAAKLHGTRLEHYFQATVALLQTSKNDSRLPQDDDIIQNNQANYIHLV